MQELYDGAFARHGRAAQKRREFAACWADYIAVHPWDTDVRNAGTNTLEILAVTREQAPVDLALIFSEWLAALRFALDNGLYALAAATSGQNPPPKAERIQFPICSTPADFKKQSGRLSILPDEVVDALEMCQPYQSPLGPESNLLYWINELSQTMLAMLLSSSSVSLSRQSPVRIFLVSAMGLTVPVGSLTPTGARRASEQRVDVQQLPR